VLFIGQYKQSQYCDEAAETNFQEWEKWDLVPVFIYVSVLVNLKIY
jgi:hypothetical protein